MRNLNHFHRILVCSFCWVIGLNPLILFEWMELMHQLRHTAASRHIHALFKIFEERQRNYILYAYNVPQAYYQYTDGTVQNYVPRNQAREINASRLFGKCYKRMISFIFQDYPVPGVKDFPGNKRSKSKVSSIFHIRIIHCLVSRISQEIAKQKQKSLLFWVISGLSSVWCQGFPEKQV